VNQKTRESIKHLRPFDFDLKFARNVPDSEWH